MVIDHIESKFGEMTKTRGDEHEFLGMEQSFNRADRTVEVLMQSYLDEAIEQSRLEVKRTAATPARKDPFEIDQCSPGLNEQRHDAFRSVV